MNCLNWGSDQQIKGNITDIHTNNTTATLIGFLFFFIYFFLFVFLQKFNKQEVNILDAIIKA